MSSLEALITKLIELEIKRGETAWVDRVIDLLPSFLSALAVAWVVHHFTRRREREKSIAALYESLASMIAAACTAASSRWREEDEYECARLIQESFWRIGRVGIVAEQLRNMTDHWRLRSVFSGPAVICCPVDIRNEILEFRRALTADPFDDPKRGPEANKIVEIEQSHGMLMLALTDAIGQWQRGESCRRASCSGLSMTALLTTT